MAASTARSSHPASIRSARRARRSSSSRRCTARSIATCPARAGDDNARLARAADYIAAHCREGVTLDAICAAADLSPSYLIRAFNARYGMTPHAFLIDRRVQYGRTELRRGRPIADVALDAGFADQAHFQRAFRRIAAATPGQYRSATS